MSLQPAEFVWLFVLILSFKYSSEFGICLLWQVGLCLNAPSDYYILLNKELIKIRTLFAS